MQAFVSYWYGGSAIEKLAYHIDFSRDHKHAKDWVI